MNTENEKKWFVYIGDHHEGPFSVSEISDKKKDGIISNESYAWCEGMTDWVMLIDSKELTSELKRVGNNSSTSTSIPTLSKSNPPKTSGNVKSSPVKNLKTSASSHTSSSKSGLPLILSISFLFLILLIVGVPAMLSRYAPEDLHAKLRPKLNMLVEKVPFLRPLYHLIPTLSDVTPEEQLELEQAKSTPPDIGPKVAIALSLADSNRPAFYLSTNLPNHTKFDIYLIGNSETLLNKLQYTAQNSLTTSEGFGKTEVFLADGGQLIPKGDYRVIVAESLEQEDGVKKVLANLTPTKPSVKLPDIISPNARFITVKSYFLGGTRDETYLTRLKQFHEKIKQNADREVQELKQYSDTLNLQYSTLTTEFNRIYSVKKVNPAMKAVWKKDSDTWQQINGQLEQTIQTWSKETIQNEFFYGKVYALVKSAYDSIKALFILENNYVETPVDHATFDIQHGKNLSETRDSLELLRTKMDAILKAPKSPSGLPTREGL